MKVYNIEDMTRGWFVGNFDPAALKTDQFEVGYHRHKAGDPTQDHYHKESTEVSVILKGKILLNGKQLSSGDIFVFEPYTVSEGEYLEDTDLIVVRNASKPGDKYLVGS
jgi:quercetin dioxygenase-like cupin family protein